MLKGNAERRFGFLLVHQQRTFTIAADGPLTLAKWIGAIRDRVKVCDMDSEAILAEAANHASVVSSGGGSATNDALPGKTRSEDVRRGPNARRQWGTEEGVNGGEGSGATSLQPLGSSSNRHSGAPAVISGLVPSPLPVRRVGQLKEPLLDFDFYERRETDVACTVVAGVFC